MVDVFARADTLERESFLFSGWRVALAFAVDNLDELIHQLESHGVEMSRGVEEASDSRWWESTNNTRKIKGTH